MSSTVIKVENLSKQYRLGQVGTGSIAHDINRTWYRIRGKQDPYLKIGEENDRSKKGSSEYVWALRDINFDVKQGEVLGIIGRNGAGKSTLLKILSRTTSPTTGNIKIRGRVASLLEVGTGFHPELTGRENIFLNGAILGMTKKEIKSKFDEIVDFAGVERYIDTPVKRYSSGMYVRLAFGVAAHLEPEILIVDEVLAVGDAEFQKKALGKMKEVSEGQGRTVLFVSHNMAAVNSLCKQSVVLQNGSVAFYGEVQKALSFYSLNRRIRNINKEENEFDDPIAIAGVRVLNERKEEVSTILSGDNVIFELTYRNLTSGPISAAIGIYDYLDTPMFLCNSRVKDHFFHETGELIKIFLKVDKFPLSEGNYYLNIEIKGNGDHRAYNTEAYSITVEKGDFYGKGILNSWQKGFMVDFNWVKN